MEEKRFFDYVEFCYNCKFHSIELKNSEEGKCKKLGVTTNKKSWCKEWELLSSKIISMPYIYPSTKNKKDW